MADSMTEGQTKDHGTAWGSRDLWEKCGAQLRGVRVKLRDCLGPSGLWAAPPRGAGSVTVSLLFPL